MTANLPEHWFRAMTPACWLWVRTECTCGWRSHRHISLDKAAGELIRHQVQAL